MDDMAQNGESSRSPSRRSPSPRKPIDLPNGAASGGLGDEASGNPSRAVQKSRLIMPEWDVPPLRQLHPSHDLISLLSLAPLYNAYVRPYASAVEDDAGGTGSGGAGAGVAEDEGDAPGAGQVNGVSKKAGGKGAATGSVVKGKRLEKGYMGLLDDCIDPVPDGLKAAQSLVPLIQDLSFPPKGNAPDLWEGPIDILPAEKWDVARLVVGSQAGYAGGEKMGVKEAEQKRQRKRERERTRSARQSGNYSDLANTGGPAGASPHSPQVAVVPGTPLLPVAPPNRSGLYPHGQGQGQGFGARRQSNPAGPGGQAYSRPANISTIPSGGTHGGPRSVGGQGPGSASNVRPGPNGLPTIPQASNRPLTPRTAPAVPGGVPQTGAGGIKRAHDGSGPGMTKKAKLAGTRSASPMPTQSGQVGGESGVGVGGQQGQGQGQGQGGYSQPPQAGQGQAVPLRPGFGRGGRARTDGL